MTSFNRVNAAMNHFGSELEAFKERLLLMGSHTEDAVARAVRAAFERNDELARQVEEHDAVLDRFEMENDEFAIHLLAKAPLASDLRLLTVGMKISHDRERAGDEATTIARRALELNRQPLLTPYTDILTMS